MLDTLRLPLFLTAVIILVMVWLIDLGSTSLIKAYLGETKTPGFSIHSLASLDGLILYTVGLMGISLVFPERLHGRAQGIATLIVSLIVLFAAVVAIISTFVELMIMIALLTSPPFGTAAYFGIYGHFATTAARVTLSLLMTLKLFFASFLVFAHQRFLQNKGLVLIILTTLIANIVISFLNALVPGFLVSITDAIGAIIVGILTAFWAIIFLVGAVIAVIKAIV